MGEEPVIRIEHADVSYGAAPVLSDVHLSIGPREFVSIVGPNGGGKTTLLRLILGLIRPDRGRVLLFGRPPEETRHRIGYLPQRADLDPHFPLCVQDVVLMGRLGPRRLIGPFRRSDRDAAARALAVVQMSDQATRPFFALSGGQRQRVLIARALAAEPDLLLLDEPTASLDRQVEAEFHRLLSEIARRLTVVLVSHDLGFVSGFVEKVVCVRRRVQVHPTSEVTPEVLREVYGAEVRMVRHDHSLPGGGPC